jgi:hypothetical protein
MRLVTLRTGMAVLATVFPAATVAADEVFLRGGGRVSGVIVERTQDAVVIETAPGRVTLAMRRVERITEGRSALQEYRERADALAPGDVDGWAALARWAAERDLITQSQDAWQRVLAVDPSHPEANAALGRVRLGGAWVAEDEAHRARGEVMFEGRWVTPAEHEALIRERAADEASARERRDAELRVREAEARVREAEARAREAEAAAQAPVEEGGIPLWWGWGGVGVLPPPFPPPLRPRPGPMPPEPAPPPPAPPSTRPSSIGPIPPGSPATPKPAPERERPRGLPSGIGESHRD